MIESLLLVACLYGNQNSCLTSAQAYYSYSGFEQQWREYERGLGPAYRVGSTVAVTAYGLFYQERLTMPTIFDFGADLDLKQKLYVLRYTRGI